MKLSCAYSIADLARSQVPDIVKRAYNGIDLEFGKEYLVPSMFDPRLLTTIPAEVAVAATKSGVARTFITDW